MSDYTNYIPQAAYPEAPYADDTPNVCVAVDIVEQQDPKQQRIAKMFVSAADVAYTPPQWLIKPYIQMGSRRIQVPVKPHLPVPSLPP